MSENNILDLPLADFQAYLGEMRSSGRNTDDLVRQYRSHNSPFSAINSAADEYQQGLAESGRRPVAGGLLSKEIGTTGLDALRSVGFEGLGGFLGAGQALGQAFDAPYSAARNLIPQDDMSGEALGTAGLAMGGGGLAARPAGSVGMGGRDGVLDFAAARAGRDKANFIDKIRGVADDVQSGRYQQRIDDAGFALHTDGAMPLQVGSRVSPPNTWNMEGDWSIDGYWVDQQNPQRYGYKLTNADGETYQAPVSDPSMGYRMDDPSKFGGGFTAYSGPRGEALAYPDRPARERATDDPISPEAQSRINAEWDALFGDINANASQSGGLIGAGLSGAQRQARDILDMRADGRAGDVTDEMMALADDQYMFANTPLDMGEAARMARAEDAGFDTGTPLYHGTPTGGFDAFDADKFKWGVAGPGVYMGDSPDVAEGYLGPDAWNGIFAEDAQIYDNLVAGTRKGVTPAELTEGGGNLRQNANAVAYGAADDGYSGLDVPTRSGAIISTTIDPSNIRSRFARFDPEFAHLSNLSAANASPTAGLLASGAQNTDKPLPFMEMLRGLLR
jgi:hypothetical protein